MSTGLQIHERRSKYVPLWVASAVIVLLAGLFGWYCYRYYTTGEKLPVPIPMPIASANQDAVETPISDEQIANYVVPDDQPRYLTIAALGIQKARIFPVGITANRELDTPRNIHDIGWYKDGGAPGDGTPAVLLDGHNGGPTMDGVFAQLDNLNVGDEIVIERGDGKQFTYVVRENKSISVEELNNGAMQAMATSIEPTRQGLNILSCTGNWIPQKKTYDQRQVVRAVLEQ